MGFAVANNKNDRTKFSVAMCIYKNDNSEHFALAVLSIINQTRRPDEVVLVVDGPVPPATEEIISSYENEAFFKVIRIPENMGHGNARRIAVENSSHELIALMDADDISVPDRFEKQIMCFEKNQNVSIVGGNIEEFVTSVNDVVGIREVPQHDREIKEYMKRRCPFNQVTVMFKSSAVREAGGYLDWYNNEDYYLWIRMYLCGAIFINLNDSLVFVRVGRDMYRRRGGWEYFKSEAKLQKVMFSKSIIHLPRFIMNILLRFVLQMLIPSWTRGLIFRWFARKRVINNLTAGSVVK